MFLRLAAAVVAVTLLAASCSSDGDDSSKNDSASGQNVGAPPVPKECDAAAADSKTIDSSGDAATTDTSEPDPAVVAEVDKRGKPDPAEMIAEVGDSSDPVVIVKGTGDAVIPDGTVNVQYSIINPKDSSVLESSWDVGQPAPIPLTQVFPAFAKSVENMKVGGRTAFLVPATDVAGAEPPPESGLTADDELIFVVDLLSVSDEAPAQTQSSVDADKDAQKAAEDRGAPKVSVPKGTKDTKDLVWIDDVVGEGDVVCPGDTVLAHYTGIEASNGKQFDSSWERGDPSEFGLDGVIQGWTDGLVGMKVGGRRTLVIPPEQAYGEESSNGGPSGVLVFTIDLIGVS